MEHSFTKRSVNRGWKRLKIVLFKVLVGRGRCPQLFSARARWSVCRRERYPIDSEASHQQMRIEPGTRRQPVFAFDNLRPSVGGYMAFPEREKRCTTHGPAQKGESEEHEKGELVELHQVLPSNDKLLVPEIQEVQLRRSGAWVPLGRRRLTSDPAGSVLWNHALSWDPCTGGPGQ